MPCPPPGRGTVAARCTITVAMTGTKPLAGQQLLYTGGEFAMFRGYTAALFIVGAVLFFCRAARTDGRDSEPSC